MKRPEPQQTLGLRLVAEKGLDAYVVPLEVEGAPDDQAGDPVVDAAAVSNVSGVKNGGIQVFIRTRDGLQVQKKGLTYQGLVKLVEKLEGLC